MAYIKRNEMAASAFGQGSNTAKQMASFHKRGAAVPVDTREFNTLSEKRSPARINPSLTTTPPHR